MAPMHRIVSAAAAAFLVAACGVKQPAYFTLRPASGAAAGAPVASLPDVGLAVGPLDLARYLDRPEIVTRDGANELTVSVGNRWGGSLRTDVLRVVSDDLGRLLGTVQIATYPSAASFPVTYRVAIDLREFEGVPGQTVNLHAVWSISDAATGRALAVEETRAEEAVASATYADLVAAQSAALGTMSRAIAERIAALPPKPPGAK